MDSLVGYGSDDDIETERYNQHTSVSIFVLETFNCCKLRILSRNYFCLFR